MLLIYLIFILYNKRITLTCLFISYTYFTSNNTIFSCSLNNIAINYIYRQNHKQALFFEDFPNFLLNRLIFLVFQLAIFHNIIIKFNN